MGAKKIGELAADGANVKRGYWQALKNRKGFPAMVRSMQLWKNYVATLELRWPSSVAHQ